MREMRRKDRQVTDRAEIEAVLRSCDVCRVGFYDGEEVYIVPLNFGYREREGRLTLFFHSAGEGRKVELFRRGGRAGFEMDCAHRLVTAETACGYSELYKSIIGTGRVREVPEPEKLEAMEAVVAHYTDAKPPIDPAMLARVRLFALDVDELSCKEHV
ncbi:pyridoxamine 5'-phosphate oxidase family protein [uncultured Oscillibacter sp.]|uniref:pyridoxamine 5'-phosphate oxidase family protein n=1 Tax=uncultured Oscillibacter sp. TaxID=876091 RepID=UPI0025DE2C60|nr:pyridoxamine 5'-phosphate oxidase family protein [uncultured Oscillibacter sp.]